MSIQVEPAAREALTVTFTIDEGQRWMDPEGNVWDVDYMSGGRITLSRKVLCSISPYDLVRTWRAGGDAGPQKELQAA